MEKIKFCLTIIFICCLISGKAKKSPAELIQKLDQTQQDTNQVYLLLNIAALYKNNYQKDSSVYYLEQALSLALKLDQPRPLAQVYNNFGYYLFNNGNPEKGLPYLHKAKEILNNQINYKVLEAALYINLGTIYRNQNHLDTAYFYYLEAEKIYLKSDDKTGLWKSQIGRTRLFLDAGDYPKAIYHVEAAFELVRPEERINYGYTLYFMNVAYLYAGEVEKYAKNFDRWNTFQNKGFNKNIHFDQRHAALISAFSNDLEKSEEVVSKALDYFITRENQMSIATHYYWLGQIKAKLGKYEEAIENFEAGIPLLRNFNSRFNIRECYRDLYLSHKGLNQYDEAMNYLEKYSILNDSINQDNMNANLNELEVKYETEKKDQTIREKTLERNGILIISALIVLLGISIILFLRNRLINNRKITAKEAELQSQKITQLEQDKKLLTYNAMIKGQEQERQRIAKDLHDGIGGLLSTVKAHFSTIQEEVVKLEKMSLYNKTNTLIDEACEEVRRISHDMMPRALELSGLPLALEDLTEAIRSKGLNCELEIIGLEERLDQHKETMIFRILQELCNNILKHAEAKNVLLQLIQKNGMINILVEDDGKGFDTDILEESPGIGLKSIQSRVKFLDGNINFDSVLGEGTTVNIEIKD